MNIFMTSFCPIQSAYDHCDVHCRKMIVEVSQLLSTAHRILDGNEAADQVGLYKATHQNHPSSIFVRSSSENYHWAHLHLEALHECYERMSGKVHASKRILVSLSDAPLSLPTGTLEPIIAASPHWQRVASERGVDVAYQGCLNEKFAGWLSRDKPMKFGWPLLGGGAPDWLDKSVFQTR